MPWTYTEGLPIIFYCEVQILDNNRDLSNAIVQKRQIIHFLYFFIFKLIDRKLAERAAWKAGIYLQLFQLPVYPE